MSRIVVSLLIHGSDLTPKSEVSVPSGAIRVFVEESGGRLWIRQEGAAAVEASEQIEIFGGINHEDCDDCDHTDVGSITVEVESP